MSTVPPPPLPPDTRPKPPGLGAGQKTLIALAVVLTIGITVLSLMFIIWTQRVTTSAEPQFGALQEAKKRQVERFDQYKDDVAGLPAGTLPPGWSCENNLKSLASGDFILVRSMATAFFSGGNEFLALDLVERARNSDGERNLSELEQSIDPRLHAADEIEKNLLAFLRDAEALTQLAVAARNGAYYVEIDPTRPEWDYDYIDDAPPDRMGPAKLLNFRAFLEARWGDLDDAVQAYRDSLRFAELVGNDPYLSNYATRCGIEWRADTVLWELIARPDFTEAHLAEILQALASREDISRLKELIVEDVELAFPRTTNQADVNNPLMERMFSFTGLYDKDEVHETALKLASLMDKPYPEMNAAVERMEEGVNDGHWFLRDLPHFARNARASQLISTLTQHTIHVALALKRFKSEHDAYPPELGALVPDYIDAIPADPITALPLAYMPWGEGCFLFRPIDPDADAESYEYDDSGYYDEEYDEYAAGVGYSRATLWHAKR